MTTARSTEPTAPSPDTADPAVGPAPAGGPAETGRAALTIRNLSRHYGAVKAVDDLSLEIPAGSFVTLLGPSGCGKSTTLGLIAGLDTPGAGQILLGDQDLTSVPPNERRMAMVFQNFALYPHMTAAQNIGFSLKLQRRSKAEIRQRVAEVAEMLDIEHLLRRKPGEMSGGQQQRVALGRALVKEPVVFLLDEPFSNLDAALRARMRTEVKHLHLRQGTTSIFVTHDQEEAMSLSDFIAVMRSGKVIQYGPSDEIYRRPRDLYVAGFVGKPRMSLVPGRVERGAAPRFVAPGLSLDLAGLPLPADCPEQVTLGVRAENVRLAGETEGQGEVAFEAVVRLLEPVGSDTFVELDAGGSSIVARVSPDLRPQLGERVQAVAHRERLHLFDTATELSLR